MGWAILPVLAAGVAALVYLGRLTPPEHRGLRFVTYDQDVLDTLIDPHAYRGGPVCQACHPPRRGRLLAGPIEVCTRCHTFGHESHPVGVVQRRRPDSPLPLGEGGRVVCHTCHDPHRVQKGEVALRRPFTPLCRSCHTGH